MLTVNANSQPGSRLRVLTLLAIAHASLAFYLWFCAFDVNFVLMSVRLWVLVAWSWFGWPVLLVVRKARLITRFVACPRRFGSGQAHQV